MGERKGQNKYYPPDFDPAKHKSLDNYHGTHALRERARKLHQGIIIIRFEMPYNIWCDGCKNHIAMGVRYNAEKSKIGKYYTTPIYKFRMKCHLCDNHFEIKTDPAKHDYVITSGARREEQRWDPFENEQIVPEDKATHKKLETDAMFKLEHVFDDKTKKIEAAPGFSEIVDKRSEWKDDYSLNKMARNIFRTEKKKINDNNKADDNVRNRLCLDINLMPENEEDVKLAGLIQYEQTDNEDNSQLKRKHEVINQSIFSKKSGSKSKTFPSLKLSSNPVQKDTSLKLSSPLVRKKQKMETDNVPTESKTIDDSGGDKDEIKVEKTSGILSLCKYDSSGSSEDE
ncbi:DgyrCDS730 [Dimorphilus gyrociliatus]|uniref:DgyrCDS730 n=1 Tax=Dimorphilus gyrociliatus TaxID=2664684 RepID=A0A7I8V5J1_9ANNE|nr:DgyrCDS730 [Dimorphilus gyrociliatus]